MFNIDEKFMEEVGILTMPEAARAQLVAGIEESIMNKVLITIADDMTDFLQSELEKIGESSEFAKQWLAENTPHYAGSSEFDLFSKNVTPVEGATTEQLYAYSKWFAMNIPGFQSIVEGVKEQVKQELKMVGGQA